MSKFYTIPLIATIFLSGINLLGQNFIDLEKIVASDRAQSDQFGGAVSISGNYAVVGAPNEDHDVSGGNTLNNSGSAYIYERNASGNWLEVQKIVPSDRGQSDQFGGAVSISGDYIVVASRNNNLDASGGNTLSNSGSAYIFERDGSGNWLETQKIVASDRANNDFFGDGVSISGDYIVVGVSLEDQDVSGGNTAINAGSAYIFERDSSGNWLETQKIVASDRSSDDRFGFAVSVSGDNIVVGARLEDHDASGGNVLSNAGSVYIFERDGSGNWLETQKIVASDRSSDDQFGTAVSISGDYIVVGARFENEDASGGNTLSGSGSAYIFERDGSGNWLEVQKIVASDRADGDLLGEKVSISGDYIVVGARFEDDDASGGNSLSSSGSAYIFERNGSGNWLEVQKIVASDRSSDDRFGASVSISGDYVVVGARGEDEDASGGNSLSSSGSAYMFTYKYDIVYANGVWTGGSGASGELTASDSGKSLSIDAPITLDVDADYSLTKLSVADGASITVPANSSLTLSTKSFIGGSGAIVLKSDANGTASLIGVGFNYSNLGSIKIERYLSANVLSAFESYHYVSSPIINQAIFGDEEDLYAYDEPTTTWIFPTDPTKGFTHFDPGAGYAMRYAANITKEFVGKVNNANVTEAVTHTDNPGDPYEYYNIFGNPYPSSMSATAFINQNSGMLSNTVNFWSGADFATYNTGLGAGTAGSIGTTPNDNIALGQAFFIESTTAGTATFTNAMRTTDSDNFYRKAAQDFIRLNVKSATDFNQIIVAQHENATAEVEALDSQKLSGNKSLSFYSICDDNKLAIQSVPDFNVSTAIPLGLATKSADWFTFSKDVLTEYDGDVYLLDSYKNQLVDLNKEDYEVFLEEGTYNNRFKLVFALREGIPTNDVDIAAYLNGRNIQLDLSQDLAIKSMRLFSINGQLIKTWTNQSTYNVADVQNGVYLLQIETKEGVTKSTRVVLVK